MRRRVLVSLIKCCDDVIFVVMLLGHWNVDFFWGTWVKKKFE